MIYGKWSVQASKQASKQTYTHRCNEVTLVWSLLRLAPIIHCFQMRIMASFVSMLMGKKNFFIITTGIRLFGPLQYIMQHMYS